MYHNHRRDGDIWQRAMDRDNDTAWAAIVSGAMSPDPFEPLPEEEGEIECDCADRAPRGEYWICPKCDAQWFPDDDEMTP